MLKIHTAVLCLSIALLSFNLTGCTSNVPHINNNPAFTHTDTPPSTTTPTSTIKPTDTSPPPETPTITPTPTSVYDHLSCNTPKSLMLHSAFGETRMKALAQVIIDNGLQTITYRQMMEYILQGICPPENAIIVSLDDMGTSWLRPVFKDMIQAFTDRGLVLVAGVVTHSEQDPEIWEYLRQIETQGIEIASHSINHLTFTAISDQALEKEIVGSYDMICDFLGTCPISLILPGGHGGDDPRVYEISKGRYAFLVGIQGGRSFSNAPPYYLGRIPPNNDDQTITLTLLENSFLP